MFYLFDQNNSGGSFVYDPEKGISVEVWIEADSADSANRKAEEIGIYFDPGYGRDCPCCGTRWSPVFEDEGREEPSSHPFRFKWIKYGYEAFVHYLDGTVKGFLR